ncbi:hypothetical protein HDA40_006934 [Hamadaea flava]|uniref:Mannosyltransferase PIG-V n=1 Tax=Hamadaea flava TaxID=1742688 RepID=A0ABV8M2P4_9ACTN|nr:hypothetical protein [Hamadaea flava]MCP2328427.1 hypothetical protein [Hamadaea flava]
MSEARVQDAGKLERTRVWQRWLPPVAVAVCCQLWMWLLAAAAGADPFRLTSGLKWDALRYVDIARRGYELHPCGDGPIDFPAPPPDAWCGNAGWFPLYPMLIKLVHVTGLGYAASGVLLSQVALVAALTVVWRLLGARLTEPAAQSLLMAVLLPGSVYYQLVFPISLALLCVAGAVLAVRNGSWAWAALSVGVGVAAYPSAAVMCLAVPLAIVLGGRPDPWWIRAVKGLGVAAAGGLGLIVVGWIFFAQTGRWDAYQLIQRNYGNGVHNPFTTTAQIVAGGEAGALAWSLLAMLIFVGPALVVAVRRGTARGFDAELILLIGLMVSLVLVPLVAGPRVSAYRSYALAAPAVVLLTTIPERLRLLMLVGLAGVGSLLTFVFFQGRLI